MSETTSHECDAGAFDRSLCPEPCNSMHSYCTICGARQEPCPDVEPAWITETRRRSAAGVKGWETRRARREARP